MFAQGNADSVVRRDFMDGRTVIREDIDSWETVMFLYNSALKEVGTKLDILNDEFVHIHKYNPIEYIKKRIKTPESIVKKLRSSGYDSTIENMISHVISYITCKL